SQQLISPAQGVAPLTLPGGVDAERERAGPLEAIKLYDELLAKYPQYAFRDQVLYQKARAYDELGQTEPALKVMEQLGREYPHSRFGDEVQFRRAEHFFIARKYRDAESAYMAIADSGAGSEYYELALYKLGWTLYKQQLYQEALQRYFALLDYKVKSGYDFDAKHTEAEQRRVEDTFQVVSLSFSNIGGPDVIGSYFATNGHKAYEDRVYRYLAEFYLVKLRYQDAATIYKSFVALYPYHQASPHYSMRVVEIYEKGSFPQLVLAAKKDFAGTYGLQGEYWHHVDVNKSPEVLSYLKNNLKDLANYYHAQYQDPKQHEQRPGNYDEATRWYREFLTSFHTDSQAPQVDYQLADLMLENHDYPAAAREYEITAYDYPPHAKSAAAGYAAIYAHREYLKVASVDLKDAARRDTINSSIKFAGAFPQHEQAPVVLAAAAQDAYELKDLMPARPCCTCRTGRLRRRFWRSSGAASPSTSCRRTRPSRSPTPISSPASWRSRPANMSASRESRRIRSCGPKRCCRRAISTGRPRTRSAPCRRTPAMSRSSASRSTRRWRHARRSRRSTRPREIRVSNGTSSRRSCGSMERRGASARIARAMSRRAPHWPS